MSIYWCILLLIYVVWCGIWILLILVSLLSAQSSCDQTFFQLAFLVAVDLGYITDVHRVKCSPVVIA